MSSAKRWLAVPKQQPSHVAHAAEPDVVKRAFDIAWECGSLIELKRRLIREGYFQVNAHLSGWMIKRDLSRRLNRRLA